MLDVMDFLFNTAFLIYAAIILQKLYKLLLKRLISLSMIRRI